MVKFLSIAALSLLPLTSAGQGPSTQQLAQDIRAQAQHAMRQELQDALQCQHQRMLADLQSPRLSPLLSNAPADDELQLAQCDSPSQTDWF